MPGQKGFAPILIVLLVAAAVGGYFVYQKSLTTPISPTPAQKACTQEAKLCPDGTSVGRTGPTCEFSPCPTSNLLDDKGIIHIIISHNEDIKATIDEKDALTNQTSSDTVHCHWDTYDVKLERGSHTLNVQNNKNNANDQITFLLNKEVWLHIYYSYVEKKLHIDQSEAGIVCE